LNVKSTMAASRLSGSVANTGLMSLANPFVSCTKSCLIVQTTGQRRRELEERAAAKIEVAARPGQYPVTMQ
jgi:hypothetical protein